MSAFKVGDVVVNFGNVAVVQEVDAVRGLLLKALPGQGFGRDDRWHADPAKTVSVVAFVQNAEAVRLKLAATMREVAARKASMSLDGAFRPKPTAARS